MHRLILAILICLSPLAGNAGLLLELYQESLISNPTLLGRTYAIDRAMAQQDQAFSQLLPQISASGNFSYNRFDQTGSVCAKQSL